MCILQKGAQSQAKEKLIVRDSTHNISLLIVIKGFSPFSSPCGSQYLCCHVIGSPFFMLQQLKGSISLSHTHRVYGIVIVVDCGYCYCKARSTVSNPHFGMDALQVYQVSTRYHH